MLHPPKLSTALRELNPGAETVFRDAYVVEFLEFDLEALDRDLCNPHDGPSIEVLLCASKGSKVVEFAFSRSLSLTLVAEYQSPLLIRRLLPAKLHEVYALTEAAILDVSKKKDNKAL